MKSPTGKSRKSPTGKSKKSPTGKSRKSPTRSRGYSPKKQYTLENTPDDVLDLISSYTDQATMSNLSMTNKNMYGRLKNSQPYITQQIIQRNQPHGILKNGNRTETYFLGKLHSYNDEPAVIIDYGRSGTTMKWYKHGELYRENGKPKIVMYIIPME